MYKRTLPLILNDLSLTICHSGQYQGNLSICTRGWSQSDCSELTVALVSTQQSEARKRSPQRPEYNLTSIKKFSRLSEQKRIAFTFVIAQQERTYAKLLTRSLGSSGDSVHRDLRNA